MSEEEYTVLYTGQKSKKAKTWHDGTLKVLSSGTKAVLYDDKKARIDSVYVRAADVVLGEQIESDRYLILIEEKRSSLAPTQSILASCGQTSGLRGQPPGMKDQPTGKSVRPGIAGGYRGGGLKRKRTGFVPPRMLQTLQQGLQEPDPTPPVVTPGSVSQLQGLTNYQASRARLYTSQQATALTAQGQGSRFEGQQESGSRLQLGDTEQCQSSISELSSKSGGSKMMKLFSSYQSSNNKQQAHEQENSESNMNDRLQSENEKTRPICNPNPSDHNLQQSNIETSDPGLLTSRNNKLMRLFSSNRQIGTDTVNTSVQNNNSISRSRCPPGKISEKSPDLRVSLPSLDDDTSVSPQLTSFLSKLKSGSRVTEGSPGAQGTKSPWSTFGPSKEKFSPSLSEFSSQGSDDSSRVSPVYSSNVDSLAERSSDQCKESKSDVSRIVSEGKEILNCSLPQQNTSSHNSAKRSANQIMALLKKKSSTTVMVDKPSESINQTAPTKNDQCDNLTENKFNSEASLNVNDYKLTKNMIQPPEHATVSHPEPLSTLSGQDNVPNRSPDKHLDHGTKATTFKKLAGTEETEEDILDPFNTSNVSFDINFSPLSHVSLSDEEQEDFRSEIKSDRNDDAIERDPFIEIEKSSPKELSSTSVRDVSENLTNIDDFSNKSKKDSGEDNAFQMEVTIQQLGTSEMSKEQLGQPMAITDVPSSFCSEWSEGDNMDYEKMFTDQGSITQTSTNQREETLCSQSDEQNFTDLDDNVGKQNAKCNNENDMSETLNVDSFNTNLHLAQEKPSISTSIPKTGVDSLPSHQTLKTYIISPRKLTEDNKNLRSPSTTLSHSDSSPKTELTTHHVPEVSNHANTENVLHEEDHEPVEQKESSSSEHIPCAIESTVISSMAELHSTVTNEQTPSFRIESTVRSMEEHHCTSIDEQTSIAKESNVTLSIGDHHSNISNDQTPSTVTSMEDNNTTITNEQNPSVTVSNPLNHLQLSPDSFDFNSSLSQFSQSGFLGTLNAAASNKQVGVSLRAGSAFDDSPRFVRNIGKVQEKVTENEAHTERWHRTHHTDLEKKIVPDTTECSEMYQDNIGFEEMKEPLNRNVTDNISESDMIFCDSEAILDEVKHHSETCASEERHSGNSISPSSNIIPIDLQNRMNTDDDEDGFTQEAMSAPFPDTPNIAITDSDLSQSTPLVKPNHVATVSESPVILYGLTPKDQIFRSSGESAISLDEHFKSTSPGDIMPSTRRDVLTSDSLIQVPVIPGQSQILESLGHSSGGPVCPRKKDTEQSQDEGSPNLSITVEDAEPDIPFKRNWTCKNISEVTDGPWKGDVMVDDRRNLLTNHEAKNMVQSQIRGHCKGKFIHEITGLLTKHNFQNGVHSQSRGHSGSHNRGPGSSTATPPRLFGRKENYMPEEVLDGKHEQSNEKMLSNLPHPSQLWGEGAKLCTAEKGKEDKNISEVVAQHLEKYTLTGMMASNVVRRSDSSVKQDVVGRATRSSDKVPVSSTQAVGRATRSNQFISSQYQQELMLEKQSPDGHWRRPNHGFGRNPRPPDNQSVEFRNSEDHWSTSNNTDYYGQLNFGSNVLDNEDFNADLSAKEMLRRDESCRHNYRLGDLDAHDMLKKDEACLQKRQIKAGSPPMRYLLDTDSPQTPGMLKDMNLEEAWVVFDSQSSSSAGRSVVGETPSSNNHHKQEALQRLQTDSSSQEDTDENFYVDWNNGKPKFVPKPSQHEERQCKSGSQTVPVSGRQFSYDCADVGTGRLQTVPNFTISSPLNTSYENFGQTAKRQKATNKLTSRPVRKPLRTDPEEELSVNHEDSNPKDFLDSCRTNLRSHRGNQLYSLGDESLSDLSLLDGSIGDRFEQALQPSGLGQPSNVAEKMDIGRNRIIQDTGSHFNQSEPPIQSLPEQERRNNRSQTSALRQFNLSEHREYHGNHTNKTNILQSDHSLSLLRLPSSELEQFDQVGPPSGCYKYRGSTRWQMNRSGQEQEERKHGKENREETNRFKWGRYLKQKMPTSGEQGEEDVGDSKWGKFLKTDDGNPVTGRNHETKRGSLDQYGSYGGNAFGLNSAIDQGLEAVDDRRFLSEDGVHHKYKPQKGDLDQYGRFGGNSSDLKSAMDSEFRAFDDRRFLSEGVHHKHEPQRSSCAQDEDFNSEMVQGFGDSKWNRFSRAGNTEPGVNQPIHSASRGKLSGVDSEMVQGVADSKLRCSRVGVDNGNTKQTVSQSAMGTQDETTAKGQSADRIDTGLDSNCDNFFGGIKVPNSSVQYTQLTDQGDQVYVIDDVDFDDSFDDEMANNQNQVLKMHQNHQYTSQPSLTYKHSPNSCGNSPEVSQSMNKVKNISSKFTKPRFVNVSPSLENSKPGLNMRMNTPLPTPNLNERTVCEDSSGMSLTKPGQFKTPVIKSFSGSVLQGTKRNLCGELQFPSSGEVESNVTPARQVTIPVSFSSVQDYKQTIAAALKEHLNIILFDLSRQFHRGLDKVDVSGYSGHDKSRTSKSSKSSNPACKCGTPSKMVQVRKDGPNKGRFFYACEAPRNQQCKFFQWMDQPGTKGGKPGDTTVSRASLSSADSITAYVRGNGVTFYCECQLLFKQRDNFKQSKFRKGIPAWVRQQQLEAPKKCMYIRLSKKDVSSYYSRDDVWVVSQSLMFEPGTTFIAKSCYFGPNSNNEVEIEPISGYSPSNWSNNCDCHAILVGNASMELVCLVNLEEFVNITTLPILPHLLHRRSPEDKKVVQINKATTKLCTPGPFVSQLAEDYVLRYKLNMDQAEAVMRVAAMMNKDEEDSDPIMLIHGVFGAGKSFLLSVLIRFLVDVFQKNDTYTPDVPYPWKLLISSTTNVAVDRVLMGLLDLGFEDFIRVGSVKKIAKPVLPYSVHASGSDSQELKDLQEMLRSDIPPSEKQLVRRSIEKHRLGENKKKLGGVRVVGVTCAACSFNCLNNIHFPFVVLDECSQMTEPASMLPVARFRCEKLVLVGDPKQLDPTIQGSEPGHREGLEQTLFDRTTKMEYSPVFLRTQYRCHPWISHISNSLFYSGQLQDGVTLEDRPQLTPMFPTLCFYDVSSGAEATDGSGSYYNTAEADLVVKLIHGLVLEGVEAGSVGVITLYKAQMYKIITSLHTDDPSMNKELKAVQVSTVDAFQGGERDVIILSCVRTNNFGFIDNDKRTNVALTRARHHLLIVGHQKNLSRNKLWSQVIQNCRDRPRGVQCSKMILTELRALIEERKAFEASSQETNSGQTKKKPSKRKRRKKDEDSPPMSLSGTPGETVSSGASVDIASLGTDKPSTPGDIAMELGVDDDFVSDKATKQDETRQVRKRPRRSELLDPSVFMAGYSDSDEDDLPTFV